MKESTELINEISQITFTHFPSCDTKRSQTKRYFNSLKKLALFYKGQFVNAIATLAIGVILLFSIYLFLIQLAENGWQ
jgi:hypothetical protein